jgi:hypothetical protein
MRRKVPKDPAELQRAVDAAAGARALADCMMYGLITGPKIDVDRCDWLLEAGRLRGIHPSKPANELAIELAMGSNAEKERR